ncbi:MAG: class I SAM-dependent methyltransferase [SAR202 cluster bacterium]|nr:class I SAM-dependent methyltransferase [SAR202 cluster bacterium]HCP24046.1 class I SAM-dependent methyltransferase [Dehalococcoidia bacterium]
MGEKTIRLYQDLAYLWPIISPPSEYESEAGHFRDIFQEKLGPGRHSLLELGVGGGHNLSHLTADFDCTAIDLSPDMLALSQELNPGVLHHEGDMRNIRLGKTFDAVLIHDAVSYLLTEQDLRETFQTSAIHLRPGGVLIVAPDWVVETFPEGWVFTWEQEKGDIKVGIEEVMVDPDPTDTQVESTYTYTITKGGETTVEVDTHTTGIFPMSTWTGLMEEAGFAVESRPLPPNQGGYGSWLFVGVLGAGT